MMQHTYENFTQAYYGLIHDVYDNADFVSSPRGLKIKEKFGVRFEIKNPRDRLPFIPERNFSVSYVSAETLWYFSGSDSTSWISKYSAFWNKISDDGVTANSAYGARIFKPHNRIASNLDKSWTQWDFVIDELANDNDSRRAIIHIRSPQDSILAKKDVPCTLTLQFFLRNDKLYLIVSMRSSDLILGIANDIPAFTLFQEAMALDLSRKLNRQIKLGSYIHVSNSLHIYENNFKMCEDILANQGNNQQLFGNHAMPRMPCDIPSSPLMTFESLIWDTQEVERIQKLIELFETCGYDEYWVDWLKLIASHRVSKLPGKEIFQRSLIENTSWWLGYTFFKR